MLSLLLTGDMGCRNAFPLAFCTPFWDLKVINFVTLLLLCECIEIVLSIKMALGFLFLPKSGSSDAKGITCQPCGGGLCLLTQQVIVCIFLTHQLWVFQHTFLCRSGLTLTKLRSLIAMEIKSQNHRGEMYALYCWR